ncbi:thioredoxin-dependent thiol peroxidase [Cytobacillus gottheilii]|uniref:thioredoxin-dependent thiol peroxidase n=1 Tax=Cytobacillus gottheilii TaxID=859144 RepID=UPI0009B9A385|nr:thioredoxin-dependent thiol peroxidase [Cytobacillus gottheilii]
MTAITGEFAPDFSLPASTGETFTLSEHRGKNIVLYFYPKDMTPGCTTQACDFRDRHSQFAEEDTIVIGISPDPLNRHDKFVEKHELPFPLLADEQHTAAELYDVWKLKKNFGKEYMGVERSTFVIDKEGRIAKEWRKVKVKDHVEEVHSFVKKELK